MKGVILAGGLGSRLHPLTRVLNKHLLPIYNKPMIYYPIETLVEAGIDEILIVTGGNNAGDFLRLLRNGRDFGLRQLGFAYQEGEGGIAAALSLARSFAAGEPICVVLGDNIIEDSVRSAKDRFERDPKGSLLLLKKVPDPERFGVPVFDEGKLVRIEEKPKSPGSPYAVVGIYFYDHTVFDRIASLKPSARGELEITDVNNSYLAEGQIKHEILQGWWTDAGTFDSLWLASNLVKQKQTSASDRAFAATGGMR
ncbi:MAG: sugar phosphate nucleotidyltransferase [Candidatus Acidiferrum sp.]